MAAFTEGQPYRRRRTDVPPHLLNWRAQSRLRQPRQYDLLRNNCEHPVFALTEGYARSPQLLAWLIIGAFALLFLARK